MATSTQTSKQKAINVDPPLKGFFSRYSKFQYQPQNSPVTEFNRLCEEYGWKQDGTEKKDARGKFNIAMKREFDSLYGSDEKNIDNWYKLCHVLKIDPTPTTIKECHAVSAPIRGSFDISFLVPGRLKETC